jgi:hypothetical protein
MVDAKKNYDDEASSEDGKKSPTPNSVTKIKMSIGIMYGKYKGKKVSDIAIEKPLQAIVNVKRRWPRRGRWLGARRWRRTVRPKRGE